MAFGPRRVRHVAGLLLIAFQVMLILSGNLSWLNWLTIAVCIACFDDSALGRLFPKAIRTRVRDIAARGTMRSGQRRVIYALTAVILILSIQPTFNMLSTGQIMNTSFDPLRIVNTYGAFGSVGRTRPEIIFSRARTTPSSMTTPCGWSTSSSASQATSTGVHALFRPITTVWIGRSRCCSPRSGSYNIVDPRRCKFLIKSETTAPRSGLLRCPIISATRGSFTWSTSCCSGTNGH